MDEQENSQMDTSELEFTPAFHSSIIPLEMPDVNGTTTAVYNITSINDAAQQPGNSATSITSPVISFEETEEPTRIQQEISQLDAMQQFSAANGRLLDLALIKYICTPHRILFLQDPLSWLDFHTSSVDNYIRFLEFSYWDLATYFVKRVLPQIYEYELNELDKQHFLLLEIHPKFQKRKTGFQLIPVTAEELQDSTIRPALKISGKQSAANDGTRHLSQGQVHNFCTALKNDAICSACLSSNNELYNCRLFHCQQLRKLISAANKRFADLGLMPLNVISEKAMLRKLAALKETKDGFVELVQEWNWSF